MPIHPYLLVALIFDALGKIMVSFTAIMVHHRVLREHSVDEAVFNSMKREQVIGVSGLALIIIGSTLEILISSGVITL